MTINLQKTAEYYKTAEPCDCAYCRNYCSKIKAQRPDIAEHLAGMGVDIEKPFELFFVEDDVHKTVLYCCCMYVVYGECEKDLDYDLGGLRFTNNTDCHPSTDITEEHFILDFGEITLDMEEI
ncbi:MAG: hypothetical protein J6O50_13415 [Ruminiclostridium sp.]|nr:hypothetical protein [Ruminiclostridium sp.]